MWNKKKDKLTDDIKKIKIFIYAITNLKFLPKNTHKLFWVFLPKKNHLFTFI